MSAGSYGSQASTYLPSEAWALMVDQPDARFHVVGESSGGLVAANAALHHPDRIASGSLVSTAVLRVSDVWCKCPWKSDTPVARPAAGHVLTGRCDAPRECARELELGCMRRASWARIDARAHPTQSENSPQSCRIWPARTSMANPAIFVFVLVRGLGHSRQRAESGPRQETSSTRGSTTFDGLEPSSVSEESSLPHPGRRRASLGG